MKVQNRNVMRKRQTSFIVLLEISSAMVIIEDAKILLPPNPIPKDPKILL
jgi:hypothetical protein